MKELKEVLELDKFVELWHFNSNQLERDSEDFSSLLADHYSSRLNLDMIHFGNGLKNLLVEDRS